MADLYKLSPTLAPTRAEPWSSWIRPDGDGWGRMETATVGDGTVEYGWRRLKGVRDGAAGGSEAGDVEAPERGGVMRESES